MGPLPVTTMRSLGSCPSDTRARSSYILKASRRILKSSSGVQDVLDTATAGLSSRRWGGATLAGVGAPNTGGLEEATVAWKGFFLLGIPNAGKEGRAAMGSSSGSAVGFVSVNGVE